MDPKSFTTEAPGEVVAAVDALGNKGFAFIPKPLPPKLDLGGKALRIALSDADRAVARLDGAARQIEHPDLLFRNYLRREAVLSSKIEGTHTTLADLVLFEAAGNPANDEDAEEVANYVKAYDVGRMRCLEIPVGRVMFRELHEVLLQGANPMKTPGQYRDCLVLIGQGPLTAARFVPPPDIFVNDLIENLQAYLITDDEPPLIKAAIAHYQFETIHPFRDGNGRIGRLLISLWLEREKVLTNPMLYLSAYFEMHRQEYYDALLRVSTEGAWEDWLLFFLRGVAAQAQDAVDRTQRLVDLRAAYHRRLPSKRTSQGVHRIIDELFTIPVITIPQAASLLGITYPAAKAQIGKLIAAGIINPEPRVFKGTAYYFAMELLLAVEAPA